jgi:hypothetical protein
MRTQGFHTIATRTKQVNDKEDNESGRIIELTIDKLKPHFKFTLGVASERLGISLTALKK